MDDFLIALGLNPIDGRSAVSSSVTIGLVVLSAVVSYLLTRYLLLRVVSPAVARSKPDWDEKIRARRVYHLLAYAAPALVLGFAFRIYFEGTTFGRTADFVDTFLSIYLIVIGLLVVNASLGAAQDIYHTYEISKTVPLTGLFQAAKAFLYVVAGLLVVANLLNIPLAFLLWPMVILTAVAGFVFKDPILGFVGGLELAANDMVAIGDLIDVPQAGAFGHVMDITLISVKVRNWDQTIANIPTYSLIDTHFVNWRGLEESGGRRIKAPIYLDASTIRPAAEDVRPSLSQIDHGPDYVARGLSEIAELTVGYRDDGALTNLSLYRAYVIGYLRHHPQINQDLMLMVRLLDPTQEGLPLEIYAFSTETEWVAFEAVQSEILDHVLSMVSLFDLRLFQVPGGTDLRELAQPYRDDQAWEVSQTPHVE